MLDLSKRSRSGKFRLVTKFKKEKNNKNREARCSLGAPGTCPCPCPGHPGALATPGPRPALPRLWLQSCTRLSRCSRQGDPCHSLP